MNEFDILENEIADLINIVNPVRTYNVYQTRNYFNILNDTEFYQRFRFEKDNVIMLLQAIEADITNNSQRNLDRTVSPLDKVLLTLRFLATGNFYVAIGDFIGIHKSSAGKIIDNVVTAICRLRQQYIYYPDYLEEIKTIQRDFWGIARFTRCIGAVDCTHIKIQSPGGNEAEIYRNRKGYFSINCQVVCDAQLKIRDKVCRWPGSAHDNHIFENCSFNMTFENQLLGDSILIGDKGYALRPHLITPLNNPQDEAENLFNESLLRTRNVVERLFGIWKRKFPILSVGIRSKLPMAQKIIVCCAILHNIAKDTTEEMPGNANNLEEMPVDNNNEVVGNGEDVRRELILYFRNLLQ